VVIWCTCKPASRALRNIVFALWSFAQWLRRLFMN